MNDVSFPSAPMMSSREIAELTGKEHFHVMRDIRLMLNELGKNPAGYLQKWMHPQNGQEYDEFMLNEELTLTLVTGYSAKLREAVIKRWKELEALGASSKFQVPTTLSSALRLAAEQAEQIERQAAQIEAQKPAVEFVGRYVDADGSKGFREVCKLLGAKENEFRSFLQDTNVVYKLGGRLVPYQPHIDAGRFEIKAGVTHDDHAYAFNQTRFTPKGIEWIAGKWMAYKLDGKAA